MLGAACGGDDTAGDEGTTDAAVGGSGGSGAGAGSGTGGAGAGGGAAGKGGGSGASGGGGMSGIVAIATCAPKGDACAPTPAVTTAYATFRKDAYLPQYDEVGAAPTTGGRVQVVGTSAAAGDVVKVVVDGVDLETIGTPDPPSTPPFEWYRVWPRKGLAAGEPLFVSFHSRAATWNGSGTAHVVVETTGGVAFDATVAVASSTIAITYATTTPDMQTVLLHVKNTDTTPHTIARVLVDGRDATAADVACLPKKTLAPGETELVRVPTCKPSAPGAARTAVVEVEGGGHGVAGLRVAKPVFPVEAWNNSDECPFPGGKADVFAAYRDAGIDTAYFSPDNCGKCGCDPAKVLSELAPATPGFHALATDGILSLPKLSDTSRILAVSTGDESDGTVYESADPNKGVPRPHLVTKKGDEVRTKYPELLTFNGGKTNENDGTFAGTADIQGLDLYVAACAPYILPFPAFPTARTAFDYLKNARENTKPLPTWLYSQGLSPAWGDKQPDPQEIIVQGFSVVAAGAKGFMWFQANQSQAKKVPARWQAMTAVNRMVRGVRAHLLQGDPTGLASADADTVVEAIRSPEAIVVPVISFKTDGGPDWTSCGLASQVPSLLKHWTFASTSPSVKVDVPDDFGVVDVFEVSGTGDVLDVSSVSTAGRTMTLGAVALSNAQPARMFVLAGNPGVRGAVKAAMSF